MKADTNKDLLEKLMSFSEDQLEMPVKAIAIGGTDACPIIKDEVGNILNPIRLEIAEYDIYAMENDYFHGIPSHTIEDIIECGHAVGASFTKIHNAGEPYLRILPIHV